MLLKSKIKTHQRRTATGKVVTVREHEDKRTKKPEQPSRRHGARTTPTIHTKKGATRIESAAPVYVGKYLESKGIPISDTESKTDGISVSKYNNKTVLQFHSHGRGGGKNAAMAKYLEQIKEELASQGLTVSRIGSSRHYVIHKMPENGLKDLPKPLREKCQRAEPGKGGEIKLTKDEVTTLLQKGRVGFISAGKNPSSTSTDELGMGEKDIMSRGDDLQKELITKGLKFVKVKGKYGEEEDSFMVMIPDVERSELVGLGRKYNQDSIIYSDKNKNEMIFTTGSKTGYRHVGTGFKYLDAKTADFYTEVDIGDENPIKFTLNFNFWAIEKVKKSLRLLKSKLGSQKPDHEYIKREGSPGHYQYTYPGEEPGSLFGKAETKVTTETLTIASIVPDPTQPRKHFDETKLKELGASIKSLGLVQDIAVRPNPEREGYYIIIAGERRYRAMKMEEIETTPAKVYHVIDPKIIASIQVAENVAREQMNPIKDGTAYKKLLGVGYSIEQIADRVGTSVTTVERRMQLLTLIPHLQEMAKHGNLTVSQGHIIATAELKPEYQQNVLKRLNLGKMSNEALSGVVGKYSAAQNQIVMFGGIDSGIDERISKTRRKSLESDMGKLVNDFSALLTRISEGGGIKLAPALAKEKGKLRVMARKINMITNEMKKLDREMQYALEYFEGGGKIEGYLNERGIKVQKRKRRRTKKGMLPVELKTRLRTANNGVSLSVDTKGD